MSSQPDAQRPIIRWATLRGLTAVVVFFIIAALVEYAVVIYALSLGVTDTAVLKIDWPVTIVVSPLFHLVPIAVIVTLVFSWAYLTKKIASRPSSDARRQKTVSSSKRVGRLRKLTSKISRSIGNSFSRIKGRLSRGGGTSHFWQRTHFARTTFKGTVVVLLAFTLLALMFSFLVYPKLIYQTVASTYRNNSVLLGFVASLDNWLNGFAHAVSPIGLIATAINNALLAAAPTVRAAGLGLGGLFEPLAGLDPASKYLIFQNLAVWISVLLILFYGEYVLKVQRYKRK